MADAPYQESRASMRKKYGSRAITYGGQSSKDDTPSGRAKLYEERGKTKPEIEAQLNADFASRFRPDPAIRPELTPLQPFRPAPRPMFAGGFASPEDVGEVRRMGGTGTLQTPYGSVTLGLSPETAALDDVISLTPTSGPLTNFSLPSIRQKMGSFLTPQSPWRDTVKKYG